MIDLDTIYENLDKMAELKRYKPPMKGYFPSVAQINTYARSKDFPFILEYLLWLDECLTDPEDRKIHKEAIAILRNIVAELDDAEEMYGGDYSKPVEVVEEADSESPAENGKEKVEKEIVYLDGYVEEEN